VAAGAYEVARDWDLDLGTLGSLSSLGTLDRFFQPVPSAFRPLSLLDYGGVHQHGNSWHQPRWVIPPPIALPLVLRPQRFAHTGSMLGLPADADAARSLLQQQLIVFCSMCIVARGAKPGKRSKLDTMVCLPGSRVGNLARQLDGLAVEVLAKVHDAGKPRWRYRG
jgi:hypothetical protein